MQMSAALSEDSLYHGRILPWVPYFNRMAKSYETSPEYSRFGIDMTGIVHHGDGVYSLPYLSPEFCASIMRQLADVEYSVNAEEEPEAQIPEAMLEHLHPELFHCLSGLWQGVGPALATCLWGMDPTVIASIQAAKYSAGIGTEWHLDQDSDVTLVVALTDSHTGGGTQVYPGAHSDVFTVPSLPVGHAMLFRGRSTLHKGLPVHTGERNLMVHWTKLGE